MDHDAFESGTVVRVTAEFSVLPPHMNSPVKIALAKRWSQMRMILMYSSIVTIYSCSREAGPTIPEQLSRKMIADGGVHYAEPNPSFGELELLRRLQASSGDLVWESQYGSPLGLNDDDCRSLSPGFTIEFYGVGYDNLWISSNGHITFNACEYDWGHPDIPDQENIIIGVLYGDFDPEIAGEVYYNTVGEAPYRRFVVTWEAVPEYSVDRDPTLPPSTFQVWIFEESNQIQLGYNGIGTDGYQWAFQPPSTDARMEVGLGSGTAVHKKTAIGSAILGLDMSNVCYEYKPETGLYVEILGPCELYDPDCPDLAWFRGKSLEKLRDLWTASNPVAGPGEDTSATFEHGGWVKPAGDSYTIEEWTVHESACRVRPGPNQDNPPSGAVDFVHTHPLAPTTPSYLYPGPICSAREGEGLLASPGASQPDKAHTFDWSQDPSNPIPSTHIIDHAGVIQVNPDGTQEPFPGCINGAS